MAPKFPPDRHPALPGLRPSSHRGTDIAQTYRVISCPGFGSLCSSSPSTCLTPTHLPKGRCALLQEASLTTAPHAPWGPLGSLSPGVSASFSPDCPELSRTLSGSSPILLPLPPTLAVSSFSHRRVWRTSESPGVDMAASAKSEWTGVGPAGVPRLPSLLRMPSVWEPRSVTSPLCPEYLWVFCPS